MDATSEWSAAGPPGICDRTAVGAAMIGQAWTNGILFLFVSDASPACVRRVASVVDGLPPRNNAPEQRPTQKRCQARRVRCDRVLSRRRRWSRPARPGPRGEGRAWGLLRRISSSTSTPRRVGSLPRSVPPGEEHLGDRRKAGAHSPAFPLEQRKG